MLALLRRSRDDLARGAGETHRLPDKNLLTAVRPPCALGNADVFDLLVREHLIDRVDRTARHSDRVEYLDPFGTALVDRALVDFRIQRVAVLGTQRAGGIIRMLDRKSVV